MGILLTQKEGVIIGNLAKILGWIMNVVFDVLNAIGIQNIGLAIIIFTIVFYTLMLPLTIKQQRATKMMSVMNPELQAIQKKYADKKDQASQMKMQEEMSLVYEKYGTSPTAGCLGSIIQLPILFALWPVVQNIPAYVSGLKETYMPLVNGIMATEGFQKTMEAIGTQKPILISPDKFDYAQANTIVDVLYKFQDSTWDVLADKFPQLTDLIYSTEESISSMNYFLGLNIAETPMSMFSSGMIFAAIAIPVLAGASQWVSAKVTQMATQADSTKREENAMTQQMDTMLKVMPLMSVAMCFSMPAGLGMYWITSAVVRTVQQIFVNKALSKKSVDEIVKENMEKAAKKRSNHKEIPANAMNEMAQKNTKNVRKVSSDKEVNSYKENAKPGSLASKANMVSDFNKKK